MDIFDFGFSAHGAFEGLRYESVENTWIDFIVVVKKEDREKATMIVEKAMDKYWESDDGCYGDFVENALKFERVEYFMFYYDSEKQDCEWYDASWENLAETIGLAMSSGVLYHVG